MSKYYTTLKALREKQACKDRYNYLVSKIGNTGRRIGLDEILKHNGIEDAIWALCAVRFTKKYIQDWYNFKADCAESVLINYESQYPDDDGPRRAIEAARNYQNNSKAAASAAASAAWVSSWSAASAAASAAWGSSWSAASAAWSAVASAASAASAARSAKSAKSAERKKQKKLFIKYFC